MCVFMCKILPGVDRNNMSTCVYVCAQYLLVSTEIICLHVCYGTHKYRHADILCLSSPGCIVYINADMQPSFLPSPASIVHINTDMHTYHFCRHQQVLCTEIHTCRHFISVVTSKDCTHKYRHADILCLSSPVSIVCINADMQAY